MLKFSRCINIGLPTASYHFLYLFIYNILKNDQILVLMEVFVDEKNPNEKLTLTFERERFHVAGVSVLIVYQHWGTNVVASCFDCEHFS